MTKELQNIYFKAETGFSSEPEEKEETPRDEQRQAVREMHGEEALKQLNLYFELLDATIDDKNRKIEREKPRSKS